MGDDLHGLAQVGALPFLVQHVPVHLAGGQVGVLVQVLVDKALVVAQVQVSLGAVIGHEHFAVLQRAHRAGVHVDIGIQLLAGHLQAAGLEQTPQTGRGDAFPQTGDHAAGHKDILRRHIISSTSMQTNKTTILYTVCGGFGKGEPPAGVYKNCGGNPRFCIDKARWNVVQCLYPTRKV